MDLPSPLAETPEQRQYLSFLHEMLDKYFDKEELETLCNELGIDYDNLPGETKDAKARELVSYLERHGRILELVETCKKLRSHVSWDGEGESGWSHFSNPATPHRLPASPENFVNRQAEIDEIDRSLRIERKSVGIFGMGGVGKTTLAQVAFHKVKDLFLQAGFACYDVKDKDPGAVISQIASDFGVSIPGHLDLEARKQRLRSALADRQALIFLDNVAQTRVVKDVIESAPHCLFVFTSRKQIQFENLCSVVLDSLPEKESVALFLQLCGKAMSDRDKKDTEEICGLLGGLPLAIQIMACRIRFSGMAIGPVLKKLKPSQEMLKRLHYSDRDIRSVFNLSFAELEETDKRLFTSLGVFAGDDFSPEAAEYISQAPDADVRLEDLVSLSLVKPSVERGRFALHPLLKSFAEEHMTETDTYYRRQAQYFFDYARRNRHPFSRLDPEAQNILGCLAWCEKQMPKGDSESWAAFIADLLGVSTIDAAWVVYLFARLYKRQGDAGLACKYYNEALQTARSIGEKTLEGACLRSLGEVYIRFKDDPGLGLEKIQEALRVLESSDAVQSKKEQIFALNFLMDYHEVNDKAQVRRLAEQVLEVRDKIPPDEWQPSEGPAHYAAVLIGLYKAEGAWQKAYELLEKERRNLEGVDLAISLTYIGGIMAEAAKFSDAGRLFEDAFEIYHSERNLGGCAWVRRCMGDMCYSQGDHVHAIECYEQAWQLRQRSGEKHEAAAALIDLARMCYATGQAAQGKSYWEDFISNYQKYIATAPSARQARVAEAAAHLGQTLIDLGPDSLALAVLSEAERLYEQARNLGGAAHVKQLLGDYRFSVEKEENAEALHE